MQAGALRQPLVFQRAATASDGRGGTKVTGWNTLVRAPGALAPLTGRQLEAAQRLAATVTHLFSVRYSTLLASLSPKDRIQWTDRAGTMHTYQIVTVTNTDLTSREIAGQALEIAA